MKKDNEDLFTIINNKIDKYKKCLRVLMNKKKNYFYIER